MKRLRDSELPEPLLARARTLLDSVEPLPESEARMRRVRQALDRSRGARAWIGRLRQLPAAVLASAMVLFGASAFAAVHYVMTRVAEPEPGGLVLPPRAKRPTRVATPARPEHTSETEKPPRPQDEVSPGRLPAQRDPTLDPSRVARDEVRSSRRLRSQGGRVAPAREPEEPEADEAQQRGAGSVLVHRAVQALRREGKPALAARLLAAHRRRSPEGPLAEEVLSLQVEAAAALGDPAAHDLASEYRERYPRGRYLGRVQRLLAGSAP